MIATKRVREILVDAVLNLHAHEDLVLKKRAIPHPVEMGFRRDIGEPRGQDADYRLEVRGKSIHVREYAARWEVHWDRVDPMVDGLEHLRQDSPGIYTAASTLMCGTVGGLIGSSTGRKGDAAAGAVIGGLIGLLLGAATAEWD